MYLCGVNAAKAIKQETLNKHCSPFAISVNIKNDKLIIRKIESELYRHSTARQLSRLSVKQSERNRIRVRKTIAMRRKSFLTF